jgi:hypothetical protein
MKTITRITLASFLAFAGLGVLACSSEVDEPVDDSSSAVKANKKKDKDDSAGSSNGGSASSDDPDSTCSSYIYGWGECCSHYNACVKKKGFYEGTTCDKADCAHNYRLCQKGDTNPQKRIKC